MGNHIKLILLSISIAAAGISFFFGYMYTGAITNDEVRCDACHVQEQDELSHSKVHTSLQCTGCHNISDFGHDLYTHNSTTLACDYCHINQNAAEFEIDAHYNFSLASNASDIFTGRNEMCIACHTGIDLVVIWHSYTTMTLTNTINPDGTWKMDFSVHGENVTSNITNYSDYLNKT